MKGINLALNVVWQRLKFQPRLLQSGHGGSCARLGTLQLGKGRETFIYTYLQPLNFLGALAYGANGDRWVPREIVLGRLKHRDDLFGVGCDDLNYRSLCFRLRVEPLHSAYCFIRPFPSLWVAPSLLCYVAKREHPLRPDDRRVYAPLPSRPRQCVTPPRIRLFSRSHGSPSRFPKHKLLRPPGSL